MGFSDPASLRVLSLTFSDNTPGQSVGSWISLQKKYILKHYFQSQEILMIKRNIEERGRSSSCGYGFSDGFLDPNRF